MDVKASISLYYIMTPYMVDEVPEHELNEWLKTLFFALLTKVSAWTNYQLTNESATFPV